MNQKNMKRKEMHKLYLIERQKYNFIKKLFLNSMTPKEKEAILEVLNLANKSIVKSVEETLEYIEDFEAKKKVKQLLSDMEFKQHDKEN